MKIFLRILTEIWQFPQHIIAYVIILINCKSIKLMVSKDGISHYLVDHLFDSAISLGNYIFLDSDGNFSYKTIKHEFGHRKQSLMLGALYLIIIGLPSAPLAATFERSGNPCFEKGTPPGYFLSSKIRSDSVRVFIPLRSTVFPPRFNLASNPELR